MQRNAQFSLLVQLASADNNVDEKEAHWLRQLGQQMGLDEETIKQIFHHPEELPNPNYLTQEERFEYLYNLIQLMKIDGKVFLSEIEFCKRAASRLGFDDHVVKELSAHIYSDPAITANRTVLMQKAFKYLKTANQLTN